MTLQEFRDETASLPGETELLIVNTNNQAVPAAYFTRDDLTPDDSLYDDIDPSALLFAEAAE